jgi:hypothetical protein
MPFPFLPGGVLLAIGVLSGAYVVFAVAIRATDRALSGLRSSMLPTVVSGLRTWRESSPVIAASTSPASGVSQALPQAAAPGGAEIVELDTDRDRAG